MPPLPDLSRFEMQCLSRLWRLGEATAREIHEALEDAPSYSTVRKILERLEEKGAVVRTVMRDRAWIYKSAVAPAAMIRKEIRGFLDTVFGGSAAPLVSHLAEMKELSVEDLREIESELAAAERDARSRRGGKRP